MTLKPSHRRDHFDFLDRDRSISMTFPGSASHVPRTASKFLGCMSRRSREGTKEPPRAWLSPIATSRPCFAPIFFLFSAYLFFLFIREKSPSCNPSAFCFSLPISPGRFSDRYRPRTLHLCARSESLDLELTLHSVHVLLHEFSINLIPTSPSRRIYDYKIECTN